MRSRLCCRLYCANHNTARRSTKLHPALRIEPVVLSYSASSSIINPLNAELNLMCHLLVLLGAHHILHVSRIRVIHFKTIQEHQFQGHSAVLPMPSPHRLQAAIKTPHECSSTRLAKGKFLVCLRITFCITIPSISKAGCSATKAL